MFRRGFKTWAEQTSLRVRQKLKLPSTAPLEPLKLAELLSVPVLRPDEIAGLASDVAARLVSEHEGNWSAITVTNEKAHLIVINSSHAATRTNSSLAHELAHILLAHEPSMMFLSPASSVALRTYNEEQEEEANWLAGALLLPRDVLLSIRRRRLADDAACLEYGVSQAMLRYRLNVTGVDKQLNRISRQR